MIDLSLHATVWSSDRRYRYWLRRDLSPLLVPVRGYEYRVDRVLFIMLNPSTADENVDDPTIRRCLGYARAWGASALGVVNLFAYRATDPRDMKSAVDPVGRRNDEIIAAAATWAYEKIDGVIVCAWGAHGAHNGRSGDVRGLLAMHVLDCLATTRAGEPRHPLYLRADLLPQPLEDVAAA